jgi:hypothetical protein
MNKGNDKDKDLDVSEFEENKETNQNDEFEFDSDGIPTLHDIVDDKSSTDFGDFEFEEDTIPEVTNETDNEAKSNNAPDDEFDFVEDVPVVKSENKDEPDLEGFDFDELMDAPKENDEVSVDDFDFSELDSTNNEETTFEEIKNDDFDFTELDSEPVISEVSSESNKDNEFNFDELEVDSNPVSDISESPKDEEFNFDEIDIDTPEVVAMKEESKDEFDLDELITENKDEASAPIEDFDFSDVKTLEIETHETKENDDFDFDVSTNTDVTLNDDFNLDEQKKSETAFDFNEVDNNTNNDFDFDDSSVGIDKPTDKEFEEIPDNEFTFDSDSSNKNDSTDFDFDLDGDGNKNEFEEVFEDTVNELMGKNDEPDVDDFDFSEDDKVDEPKDIVNNENIDYNSDEGNPRMKDEKEFEFDDEADFDFSSDSNDKNNKTNDEHNDQFDDFDFGSDAGNNKNDFDTSFDLDEDKTDFGFENTRDEDNSFANDVSHEEQEEHEEVAKSDEPSEKKATSPIIKYASLGLGLLLLGGAGFYGYEKFMVQPEEEEIVTPVKKEKAEKKPVEKKQKTETPKANNDLDLTSLNEIAEKPASKTAKPISQPTPVETISSTSSIAAPNAISKEEYERLQNQFAQVIGSVSKMSNEVDSLKAENQRMKRIIENTKQDNSGFESFQLDISGIKTEVGNLKKQVLAEKEFNKETMMKFLMITKKLKEEVNNVKSSQFNKEEVEAKLEEINNLSKQIEMLNTKVANTEVMNKIATLEKSMNDKKLQEVENKLNKSTAAVTRDSNKQKSVLELLEEKNKEKRLEKNAVVVEEDEDLRVPLSVTIEENAASERPVVRKQEVKPKQVKQTYYFIGTIEGVVYLKNSAGSISEYRVGELLPGYGEVLKIYKDGSIETENGNVRFNDK